DEVELIAAGDGPVEIDFRAKRAKILLDRAGRSARRAGGAVEARADHAADPERGGVDPDRPRIESEAAARAAFNRELQIEPGTKRERFERPMRSGRRPPSQRQVYL